MLRCRAQLVEDHRLDIERALIDESGAQARLIDQPPEQVEIGIRRQHDVNAAARLEALTIQALGKSELAYACAFGVLLVLGMRLP